MKKSIKILSLTAVAIVLIVVSAICFAGCGDDGTLSPPDGLKIDDEILIFNNVDGAYSYVVSIDGKEYETKDEFFDLFELFNESKPMK